MYIIIHTHTFIQLAGWCACSLLSCFISWNFSTIIMFTNNPNSTNNKTNDWSQDTIIHLTYLCVLVVIQYGTLIYCIYCITIVAYLYNTSDPWCKAGSIWVMGKPPCCRWCGTGVIGVDGGDENVCDALAKWYSISGGCCNCPLIATFCHTLEGLGGGAGWRVTNKGSL